MTTSVRVVRVTDVFSDNEVINVHGVIPDFDIGVSARSWSLESPSLESMLRLFRDIYILVGAGFSGWEGWLIVRNSAWQPNTKVVWHRRLWAALKFRGFDVVGGSDFQESSIESVLGVKFSGAVRISNVSVESVVKILLSEQCSYIVFLPEANIAKDIINAEWSGDISKDIKLICSISAVKGMLLDLVGEFDDCEKGYSIFGSPDMISRLS
ncbi:hypothetical protein ABH908_003947 [Pseudomonas frederiksbergensis]|uniref:hypothetical protein n=1 Tax=Pseudomonas TaxID=286 RepID=UPI001E553254|nr:hypothetical protein [Pseudomonas sp. Bi130]